MTYLLNTEKYYNAMKKDTHVKTHGLDTKIGITKSGSEF